MPALLMLGGSGMDDEAAIGVWTYPLGRPCATRAMPIGATTAIGANGSTGGAGEGDEAEGAGIFGCPRGQQCDGTTGVCLCADGLPPTPHTRGCIRKPAPPPGLELKPGA